MGSIAAVVAAVVIYFTGRTIADTLASILIAILIIVGAARLIRESLHYLLEGTPRNIQIADVAGALRGLPGVLDVHDLHLWRISSGMDILTAHVVLEDLSRSKEVRGQVRACLRERFGVSHATIEVEGVDEAEDPGHSSEICDG